MISERDLEEAIAECIGQRNPTASTAVKLAAFYTIRREMYGKQEEPATGYSFASQPENYSTVEINGDSDFARTIRGRRQEDVWPVVDELVQTVRAIYPRLYAAMMRELM